MGLTIDPVSNDWLGKKTCRRDARSGIMELTGDEVAAIGQKIYEGMREEMEASHWGELVVIDVHSGDYEVGEYTGLQSDVEIGKRLLKRRPDAFTWAELVGQEKYISARLGWRGTMEYLASQKEKASHD